jgi:hypothetical protein
LWEPTVILYREKMGQEIIPAFAAMLRQKPVQGKIDILPNAF